MNDIIKQVIAGVIILILTPIVMYFLGWWPKIFKFLKWNKEQDESRKTPYDLFIDFLDKKASQNLIYDPSSSSVSHSMHVWEKKVENGLMLFFGEKQIDGVIKNIFQDIHSRVIGLGLYPSKDTEEVKRIVAKCQGYVQEMKKHINPTMMSKEFNPYDLDK